MLEELWHLELRGRPAGLEGATRDAYLLFTPVLAVTDETFRRALDLEAPGLGANDRLHAALCALHGLPAIVSADASFDAIPGLTRLDPRDPAALEDLQEGHTNGA